VIFGAESHGTYDPILLSGGSGNLQKRLCGWNTFPRKHDVYSYSIYFNKANRTFLLVEYVHVSYISFVDSLVDDFIVETKLMHESASITPFSSITSGKHLKYLKMY
jgi:hypothetical protein